MHIHAEIQDRYGRIPPSVESLFAYGRLRKTAEKMFVVSVDKAGSQVAIKLSENAKVDPEKLMRYLAENEKATFSPSGILRIEVSEEGPIVSAMQALGEIQVS